MFMENLPLGPKNDGGLHWFRIRTEVCFLYKKTDFHLKMRIYQEGGIKAGTALATILKMDSVLSLDVIKNAFTVLEEQAALNGTAAGASAGGADAHAGDPEAAEIDALVAERTAAKKNKDFARADEIRNQLTARGVIIIDTPNGPTWKRG